MPSVKARFDAAAQAVQELKRRPDNDTLLELYACYKQATSGNVSGKRPGLVDFVGRTKYDAWAGMKDTPKNEAMQRYIELVERLVRAQA